MKKRILIVEDSVSMLYLEEEYVKARFDYEIVTAKSYKETQSVLAQAKENFLVALLDLNLPDAQEGEIVDLVVGYGIPIIVFTATFNESRRNKIMQKEIVDYVIKGDFSNFEHVLNLIDYIDKNQNRRALVIDDSFETRMEARRLLSLVGFEVTTLKSAIEALELIKDEHYELIVVDKTTADKDGIAFIKELRRTYSMDDIALIGLSSMEHTFASIEFLKYGANDFLHKPFVQEEFTFRVMQTMRMQHYVKIAQDFSNKDPLTGTYNRRYLLKQGINLLNEHKDDGHFISVAMIDIDNFKSVNDTYGHLVGDDVIIALAKTLQRLSSREDIVVRYGGEEFLILFLNHSKENILLILETIRHTIESITIESPEGEFSFTISIGVCMEQSYDLMRLTQTADDYLYMAKQTGKNKIVYAPLMIVNIR